MILLISHFPFYNGWVSQSEFCVTGSQAVFIISHKSYSFMHMHDGLEQNMVFLQIVHFKCNNSVWWTLISVCKICSLCCKINHFSKLQKSV